MVEETFLVDTDVHEYMASRDDLLPYLDDYWKYVFASYDVDRRPAIASAFPYLVQSGDRLEWRHEDGNRATDLDRLRRELFDDEGVSIGILNGFFHASAMPGNFEFAAALASAYNDWQIETLLDNEPRLRGSVHVVAQDPAAAAREIDRVAAHPQIVQVFLPAVTDRLYGDPYYRPILEAAVRNELAVAMHHGPETQTVAGYPRNFMEWHTLAAPQVAASQLMSLICNGSFDLYPDLTVVVLEAGVGWMPWLMWRADQQYRELRRDIPWVKRRPSDHIRNSVRIGTQPLSDIVPRDFLRLIEMTSAEEVFVFASDYPHWDADSADKVLKGPITAELQSRIRHRNALAAFPRLRGLQG